MLLKGQCHESSTSVFFMNQFPPSIWVRFKVSAAWYCSHYLPPASLTQFAASIVQICHRCQQHKRNRWQNLPLVSLIPVANLPPVSLIPAVIYHWCHWHRCQICHRCRWHRWCTLTCEYLRKFSKKFEITLTLFSGAWGKVIHEKNLKKKISWNCPFKKLLTTNHSKN